MTSFRPITLRDFLLVCDNNYQHQSGGFQQQCGSGGYRPYRGRGGAGRWTRPEPTGRPDFNNECSRCGRYNHQNPQICPYINDICHFCSRSGHHQVKCRAWLRTQKFGVPLIAIGIAPARVRPRQAAASTRCCPLNGCHQ